MCGELRTGWLPFGKEYFDFREDTRRMVYVGM
jgi:hypothetical protein